MGVVHWSAVGVLGALVTYVYGVLEFGHWDHDMIEFRPPGSDGVT